MKQTRTNWQTIEAHLRDSLATVERPLQLADTPEFPLAFNVPTADSLDFPNANLSIRFEGFSVTGLEDVKLNLAACSEDDRSKDNDNRLKICLQWAQMRVDGRYVVSAKEVPALEMDTAGTLMALDENDDRHIQSAGADSDEALEPDTKDAMLEQARLQRQRLMDTPNGQKLLERYNEHNEIYNTVFVTSTTARRTWAANGATKDMSVQTHTALGEDSQVNPDGTTYGSEGVTYNENAFRQQVNIVTNSILADPDANLLAPPNPDSAYTKASLAALTFGRGVGDTGNSPTKAQPMTGSEVMGAVDAGAEPAEATIEELSNAIAQGVQDGGKAADDAKSNNWRILTEEERKIVRRCHFEAMMRHIEAQQTRLTALWEGACQASINGAQATFELHAEDEQLQVCALRIDLPAFEFNLDDAHWAGEAAQLVRARLTELSFVRSLLHQQIQSGLVKLVRDACRIDQQGNQQVNRQGN